MEERNNEAAKAVVAEEAATAETIADAAIERTATEDALPHCCCSRKTIRTAQEQRRLINRLSRIEGQIRGIKKMVESNAYCNDILIQSAAVNAAVNSFNRELLSAHIKTCVTNDLREGNEETVDELVKTLQKLMK